MNLQFLKENKNLALFALLGLGFLALMLVLGLKKPAPTVPEPGKALFSLTSSTTSVSPEQTFTVELSLTTNGEKITAADAYLEYDPAALEVVSLTSGKIFSSYPALKVKKLGEVLASGLNSAAEELAKDGVFAIIEFKAKGPGQTKISLGKDSLAAFEGRNVLDLKKLPSLVIQVK